VATLAALPASGVGIKLGGLGGSAGGVSSVEEFTFSVEEDDDDTAAANSLTGVAPLS